MTPDEAYTSYRIYEAYVESEVKAGRLSNREAARYLKEAKENYKNQNYNREMEKIKRASRN